MRVKLVKPGDSSELGSSAAQNRKHKVASIKNLDENILLAINSNSPKTILWANAGVGKSSAIVGRVLELLKRGVDPKNILVISYGRERANELRDEIVISAGIDLYEPLVRTFHAVAFSILNEKIEPDDPSFVLMSGAEQEALIRELLDSTTTKVKWPDELQLALKTRGFVKELRELISRASEFNITPKKMKEMAITNKEPWWNYAADFFEEYLATRELASHNVLESPIPIDTSSIIQEAVYALKEKPELAKKISGRYQYLLIDDFQESDLAQRQLVEALSVKEIFITADPDSAVGRFRGADPDGVREWTKGFEEFVSSKSIGKSAGIEYLDSVITSRLGGKAKSPARRSLMPEVSNEGINFAHLESEADAASYIAQTFRHAHLVDKIKWSQMVVILRSPGSSVSALHRAFLEYEIPISLDPTAVAIAQNPVIKPLLKIAEFALNPKLLAEDNWGEIEEVLRSAYCGADSISLRQMRIWLAQENKDNEVASNTTNLLLNVIKEPDLVSDPDKYFSLVQLGNLISGAKKVNSRKGDIYEIIWEIWDNAIDISRKKVSAHWQETALKGGVTGLRADQDLDSVMYLFQSALRYLTRTPHSKPQAFIDYINSQEVVGDAIVNFGKKEEVVEILTVHSTQGKSWELVAVFGLQDGVWPNYKVRGSLLGSERLAESMRSSLSARDQIISAQNDALVDDERRLLHVAITRAKSKLILSVFTQENSQPSRYASEICETLFDKEVTEIEFNKLEIPLTLPAIVATARRELMDQEKSVAAAQLLATLASAGVRGADPKDWLGNKDVSSSEQIVADGENIFLSPSALDRINKCPLFYFLQKNGGSDGDSAPALIGTAIHALAADLVNNPDKNYEDFAENLERNFSLLSKEKGWVRDYELAKAKGVLKRLFDWLEYDQSLGRKLVATERKFRLEIGRAILNGSIDRIEKDADGKLFIVDLKTGKKWDGELLKKSLQVQVYQLAAEQKKWLDQELIETLPSEVSGGALVFFREEKAKPKTYEAPLPELNEESRAALETQLNEISDGVSGINLIAQANKDCSNCSLRSSCPLQPEGRWVI